jgi:hypothetical protein
MDTYEFVIVGHGHRIPCRSVTAKNEDAAYLEAMEQCKFLELPGWSLICTTTGNIAPAVEFQETDEKGNTIRKERM